MLSTSNAQHHNRVLQIFSPSTPIFKYWVNFPLLGLPKDVFIIFLGHLAQKLHVVDVWSAKIASEKDPRYYKNHSKTFFISALQILTSCHIWANWPKKKLHISFESPKTGNLTQCLKMVVTWSSEAIDKFQRGQKDMEDNVSLSNKNSKIKNGNYHSGCKIP